MANEEMEDSQSESALIARLKSSDVEAFRILFERHQPVVLRSVLFQTRQPGLAHDIVQETFLRIWERRAALDPRLSLIALALRISRNLLVDAARHRAVRERLEGQLSLPALSEGDDPEEALQLSRLEEKLARIINEDLAERCRQVFVLSRFEGKSHHEIADLLGVSVRTVENQINKALKVIRRKLQRS